MNNPLANNEKLTWMLGIYFCLILLLFLRPFMYFITLPDLYINYASGHIFFYPFAFILSYFLAHVFGIWAIILTLKGSPHAICSLKASIPVLAVSFCLAYYEDALPGLFYYFDWQSRLLVLFFYAILFFSLCSEQIKEDYPPEERRYEIMWLFIICLYILPISATISYNLETILRNREASKIYSDLELTNEETCDGHSIFIPKTSWRLDSLLNNDDIYTSHYIDTCTGADIDIFSWTEDQALRLPYRIRTDYLRTIMKFCPIKRIGFSTETGHKIIENEERLIYVDQYHITTDSTEFEWAVATRFQKDVPKMLTISILERDTTATYRINAVSFLENATLDLKNRSTGFLKM